MAMPSISLRFLEMAATAIRRGSIGTVGLILKGTVPTNNPVTLTNATEIPSTWSADNKFYAASTFYGGVNPPKKVICYFIATDAESYDTALNDLSTRGIDFMAIPTVTTDSQTSSVISWTKAQWADDNQIVVVLPNAVGDYEGIVNFATESITADGVTYTTEKYTPRIAGLLAGTPLDQSSTYLTLPEVEECTRLTKAERDAAVDAGKFIIWMDGDKCRVGRGVNSLTTTSATKNRQYKKIHIVDIMRLVGNDIRTTIKESYIGRYMNSYDNKILLLSAIRGYLDDVSVVAAYDIDISAEGNATYLKSKGIDVSDMTEDELRKADTDDHVFLAGAMTLLDAMEDVDFPINI